MSQELVIYEVGESGEVASEAAVTVRLPATASSWTPNGSDCLERGRSYAWSVRVLGDADASDWGEARFLSIAAVPSEEELATALEVLQARAATTHAWPITAQPPPVAASSRAIETAELAAGPADDGGPVRTLAAAITAFRVAAGGAVEAPSFTGDGSDLYNIGSAAIATNAVGASEIAANAVGSSELADYSVTPSHIYPDSITSGQIAAGAVGSSEIASSAVGTSEIAADAVGSSEIADGAIGASEMAGHFCLVVRGENNCPSGYTWFFIRFDTEDNENGDICTESVAVYCSSVGSYIDIGFCCA
jgi:hypothetical protein